MLEGQIPLADPRIQPRFESVESTHPCTQSSFTTKNLFDTLQDLSEEIGGSNIWPRKSEDDEDCSWTLEMSCQSPLPTTCTSR